MLRTAGQPWEQEAGELLWLPHGLVGLDCPQTEEAWRHYCVCAQHMERYMWGWTPVRSVLWIIDRGPRWGGCPKETN